MRKFLSISILIILLFQVPASKSQAPVAADADDRIYLGYYWGAAGIASFLNEFATQTFVDQDLRGKANIAVSKALDYIWDSRIELDDGTKIPAWGKSLSDFPEVYPGQKYGAAGISKVFLEVWETTKDETYLEMAMSSMRELMVHANASENPHWSYAYVGTKGSQGIPITDIKYGNLGIVDTLLDLYDATAESEFLEYAISTASWLDDVGRTTEVDGLQGKIIPWYGPAGGSPVYLTAYGQGNAGAIPIFHRLFEATNDSIWLNWAIFLGNWFKGIQLGDGKWSYNANLPDQVGRTDLDLGVAGILQALEYLNTRVMSLNLDDTLMRGYGWLESQLIKNATHIVIPQVAGEKYGRNDLLHGLFGVAKSFRESSYTSFQSMAMELYQWVLTSAGYNFTIQKQNLFGVLPTSYQGDFLDLSYSDGIAGIGMELLDIVADGYGIDRVESISIIEKITRTLLFYQLEDGSWPRQVESIFDERPSIIGMGKSDSEDSNLSIAIVPFTVIMIVFTQRWVKSRMQD